MASRPLDAAARPWRRPAAEALRVLLPALGLALILGLIFWIQPRAMSYLGLRLLLNYSIPLMFAAMAQMCVIAASDIDLGIGPFIAMVCCICVTWLVDAPILGILALVLAIAAYALMGALIHLRRLPSIVVTLGAAFVWLGLALLILPVPGGAAPAWLQGLIRWRAPWVPLPIVLALLLALLGHLIFERWSYGAVLRGVGGNPAAVERAGWSLLRARMTLYGLAGFFGVLAGLGLAGLQTTGDANSGASYTLTSIAAVIVGGGEFSGGVVSATGTVMGAMVMLLTGALLSFLDVSSYWQLSVQGLILIAVLSLRTAAGARRP
jgi:ribose/xylose/arabinose/galactoside ABC-type transport system permease subunit